MMRTLILAVALVMAAASANAMCIEMNSDIGFEIDFECGLFCGKHENVLSGKTWCVKDKGGKVEINAYPSKKDYGPQFFSRVGNIHVTPNGRVVITGQNGYYTAYSYDGSGHLKEKVALDYR